MPHRSCCCFAQIQPVPNSCRSFISKYFDSGAHSYLHGQFPGLDSWYLSPGPHNIFTGLPVSILSSIITHVGHCSQSDLDIKPICLCFLALGASIYLLPSRGKFELLDMISEEILYNLITPPACPKLFSLCPSAFSFLSFPHLFKTKLILSEVFTDVPGRVGQFLHPPKLQ